MIKILTELAPLAAFFIGFKYDGIYTATLAMLIASIIAVIFSYLLTGRVQKSTLLSLILIIITASITLLSGNVKFIKMKPTIFYLIFSLSLFISVIRKRPLMQYMLSEALTMPKQGWDKLSLRFGCFFGGMAILNEIIWRYFDESIWVKFKVFGATFLFLIFLISQLPLIIKHYKPHN